MEIRIIFSTSSSWLSKLIRWVTRSKVSHASICVIAQGLPILVLQSTVGGVQAMSRTRWNRGNRVIKEFRSKIPVSLEHACRLLGERYDYVGLIGYIPVLLGRWLGKKVKNPLASPRALVCAEFVLHLSQGQIPEWKGLDPEGTTPEDLLEVCDKGASFEAIALG